MRADVILCQQKRHRAVPMPISANATITALTVAKTIDASLTFIIKKMLRVHYYCSRKTKCLLALPIPKFKILRPIC